MHIKATMSFRYLWRLGLIAIICLGGCLYCLYDGFIAYPKQGEALQAFEELKKQYPDEEEFWLEWDEKREQHNEQREDQWPHSPKGKYDIIQQYVMAGLLVVPGLIYLFLFIQCRPRWIEMDDNGLRTSWGPQLEFDQIVTLNKKKWKTKGIAKINYSQDGRERRLALDDWKFDTDATKAILREIESRINVQQIVGGPPETPEGEQPSEESQETTPPTNDSAADQNNPT